jgi:hypothetical protein
MEMKCVLSQMNSKVGKEFNILERKSGETFFLYAEIMNRVVKDQKKEVS